MRAFLLTVVTTLAIAAGKVHAQRPDSPRVPQPISVTELQRYGDILGLSDGQRLAVEAAYDDYLDEFDPLRREMIEAAVANPQFTRTGEDFTALLPAFVTRVQGLDESFFARVDPMLADEQRERLPRVRDLRTRSLRCNIDALGRFIGDSLPELREILEELDPPPEILTPLMLALVEHERKATIGVRDIFDATMRLCGSAQPDDQAKDRLIDGVKSLRAMNRKLVDDLAPSLPADIARKWHGEFLGRAYGHAAEISRLHAIPRMNAALATDLSEAERASVQTLRDSAIQFESQTLQRMLDLHDKDAIRHAPAQGAIPDPVYYETVNAVQQEVMARDHELTKSLNAALSADRVKALKPANEMYARSSGGLRSACGVTVNVGRIYRPEERRGVPMSRSDPMIPAPLTAADGELIAAAMHFNAAQRADVIERVQAAAAALEESLKPSHEQLIQQTMWKRPGSEPAEDPLARAQAGDATRVAMRGTIRQADGALLEEIRAAHGIANDDPAWQRLVRLRERAMVTLDMALRPSFDANGAGEIDLMRLLLGASLDAPTWTAIEPVTSAYERDLLGMLAPLHEAFGKYAARDAAQRGGWRGDGGYEAMRDLQESLHKQLQALAAMNQESIARIVAALPAEHAAAILDEYNKAAFPLAYTDRASVAATLERAAVLPGLTAEQRERIGETRAEFETAGDDVRRAIVDVCAAVKPDLLMVGRTITPERAGGEERFTLEYDRLNDERAQINRRAMRSLRTILTPEQMSALLPAQAQ